MTALKTFSPCAAKVSTMETLWILIAVVITPLKFDNKESMRGELFAATASLNSLSGSAKIPFQSRKRRISSVLLSPAGLDICAYIFPGSVGAAGKAVAPYCCRTAIISWLPMSLAACNGVPCGPERFTSAPLAMSNAARLVKPLPAAIWSGGPRRPPDLFTSAP
ncbi:hypothetical protein BJY01DRAFT_215939 [Aspergillus pseudoustus]|uniref:Uncharacterized protein n=1 Tax=Aspergillus pseudoustus TaxID=1810923 RepID=A0ABR4JTG8_9EURO